jgi:Zn-dependent protease with chaperone function
MKQKAEKLAKQAGLQKIPAVKISKKERVASVSVLRKRISVGTELLSQWSRGEIDEDDVEATLAHEIGHIMDFDRKFRSVYFRSNAIALPYITLGVILPKVGSYLPASEPWIPSLLIFIVWAVFLPWILRRTTFAVQFEADRNASRLIGDQQLANSIVKRSRFHPMKTFGPIETWELLSHVILFPFLNERLQNLGFEIKGQKTEIQRIRNRQAI